MTEKLLLLYTAWRDARTPWYAKALLLLILAYVLSPIDIIPDFIPVIGLLDELILVPIALAIVFRLIPAEVKQQQMLEGIDPAQRERLLKTGLCMVVSIWFLMLTAAIFILSV